MEERPDAGRAAGDGADRPGGGPAPDPWPRLGTERLGGYRVFAVRRDMLRSPRTGEVMDRFVLEMPDWVNVVPVTTDGCVVMVEQFRPGTGEVTLEFPAGIVESGEDACGAGLRELEEETGYRAEACRVLGVMAPNPALQDNRLSAVTASGCTATGRRAQDAGEDVVVRVVKAADVPRLIAEGRITHALTIATWHLYVKAVGRAVGSG